MKATIRQIFVDPCLKFKRVGMQASLWKVRLNGTNLENVSQIQVNSFCYNYFDAANIQVGDILCHSLTSVSLISFLNLDRARFFVVVGMRELEIEFSEIFGNVEDLCKYLNKRKK